MRQHRVRGIAEQRQPAACVQAGSGSRSYSAQRNVVFNLAQQRPDARVPALELAREARRDRRAPTRILHFRVGRHEADIVDELA